MKRIHKITDIVRLGLHGVVVHKARSALTILGILFGVWSVIAMLAINEGLREESQRALRELGSTNIIVDSVKPESDQAKAAQQQGGAFNYGLKRGDVARLKSNVPGVESCAIMHQTTKIASAGTRRFSVVVVGVEANYDEVAGATLSAGRFVSDADVLRRMPHAVIPQSLARRLFGYRNPIGETLYLTDINPKPFIVIGMLRELPNALITHAGQSGDCVLIPITTEQAQFGEMTFFQNQGNQTFERVEVSQCILRFADEHQVVRGAQVVRQLLERFHEERDYTVRVPAEQIRLMEADRKRWNFMFVMIASVSLLVGGIGIMNIMLASVTERTREIGVRRALGAKKGDIITQFLVESVTLTAIGGLLGIIIGLAVPWAIEQVLEFQTLVTPMTLILPFMMAVLVGLLSGLYPATRAAKLDPINALRHE